MKCQNAIASAYADDKAAADNVQPDRAGGGFSLARERSAQKARRREQHNPSSYRLHAESPWICAGRTPGELTANEKHIVTGLSRQPRWSRNPEALLEC